MFSFILTQAHFTDYKAGAGNQPTWLVLELGFKFGQLNSEGQQGYLASAPKGMILSPASTFCTIHPLSIPEL